MSHKMRRGDIPRQELIGLEAEVVDATNKDLKGIKGVIVDETKSTLTIARESKRKILLKEQVTLDIRMGDNIARIDGKVLLGRPEDRIKK